MDAPLLTDDFKEFLRLLNAYRVDSLLVGGYAVGLHGYPRATVDLDVWVRATPENADRIVHALRVFGFDLPSLEPRGWCPGLDDLSPRRSNVPPAHRALGRTRPSRSLGQRQSRPAGRLSASIRGVPRRIVEAGAPPPRLAPCTLHFAPCTLHLHPTPTSR